MREPIESDSSRSLAFEIPEPTKLCGRCGGWLPLEAFTADQHRPDGRGTYCLACGRERAREFYARNREVILARAAARRGTPSVRHCSECGAELEGRSRVCCGASKCREARFKRENPEAYAAREAAKVERRREARRRAREAAR